MVGVGLVPSACGPGDGLFPAGRVFFLSATADL